jgi:SAM-dependent methyltransferase
VKSTGERRKPGFAKTIEARVQDVLHSFPYHFVRDLLHGGERVLEVGFGEGYGAKLLEDSLSEYHGIEVSSDAYEHASTHYSTEKLRFWLYDGDSFPFDDDRFDFVISFHVLEHLEKPTSYLREMRRVCRGGGTIVIVTPNRIHRLLPGERPWNRFHLREFDPEELHALLSTVFVRIELMGFTGSEEMNAVERARIAKARHLAKLDPLGLRYLLPEWLMFRVRRFLSAAAGSSSSKSFEPSLGQVECFRKAEDGLHLMAVIQVDDADKDSSV